MRVFRLVAIVAFTLVTGLANAQDCSTAVAPACGGTCPTDSVCRSDDSSGVPACGCVATTPLGVKKLSIKLNFAKSPLDSIQLQGTIPVDAGFTAAGAQVVVDVGGVVKSFTLGDKGKIKIGYDQAQLGKPKDGVAKYAIKIAKGTFATTLRDEGLDNVTVTDVPVSIPLEVQINGKIYQKAQPQTYTAKAGKTGKTK